MCDGNLGDAEAALMREDGDEAMQLAVELDVVEQLAAVRLEAAVDVVQLDASGRADHAVEDARRKRLGPRVQARILPPGNEIVAFVELLEEAPDLRRIVLQIGVHREDDLATRHLESGDECGRLAKVAPETDDVDSRIALMQRAQLLEGAVPAAVVDKDDFPGLL